MRPIIGITGRKDTSARLLNSPMYSVGQTYVNALHNAGGTPLILPPLFDEQDWPGVIARLDGLLLSGGEDIHPQNYRQEELTWMGGVDLERDHSELGLVRSALDRGLPILAICRGHQLLNIALGGTLFQDLAAQIPNALDHAYVPGRPMEQTVHTVTLDPDSHIANLLGGDTFAVNSVHHQGVDVPGQGLTVVGYAPDGVVEALELAGYPFCYSVQWHPEAMLKVNDTMLPLFAAFVNAAGQQATHAESG
ncbi:MAG: gamma-glutamyl-gamma-aminobutyrate hydrolase family protein [Anaerolineae bacterium]|nr:gamma-glutamyl-gamma-aminobutyrate hydrolase family protein [Anaerolineae bacterium]